MKLTFGIAALLLVTVAVSAGEFATYPGAKLDEGATQKSQQSLAASGLKNRQVRIFTTGDAFEKVCSFYRDKGTPYQMPGREGEVEKLPSGEELKETYFIFDGAPDLGSSKMWAKIQRPYIGGMKMTGLSVEYEDVRNVTAIVVTEGK